MLAQVRARAAIPNHKVCTWFMICFQVFTAIVCASYLLVEIVVLQEKGFHTWMDMWSCGSDCIGLFVASRFGFMDSCVQVLQLCNLICYSMVFVPHLKADSDRSITEYSYSAW